MITSLLDNDFYQFTMSHAMYECGDGDLMNVRYEFRNRTFSVPLAHRISLDKLREQIEEVRELSFGKDEIKYLHGLGYFSDNYLHDLALCSELPPVHVGSDNGHLVLNYEGPWWQAIFWETILLGLVNELYYERFRGYVHEGVLRLKEKIEYLRERNTIKVVEFGTRRRHFREWQHVTLHKLVEEIPHLVVGTSNVSLAREFDLAPKGTMAHQLFMVQVAAHRLLQREYPNTYSSAPAIKAGTERVLDLWTKQYARFPELMTVLPDTYTTQHFIESTNPDLVRPFLGFRQDSGDPVIQGWRLYSYARALRDMRPKIMFSDGLNVRSMSVIDDIWGSQADLTFGWGTDLTNDLGFEPLAIVIKPCAVQVDGSPWEPCVKISDDRQKATGTPAAIQQYLQEIDQSW